MRASLKRLSPCLAVFALAGSIGCAGDPELSSNTDRPSFEAWVQSLYREPETGRFIVDWDMPVSTEAELRPYYERLFNGAELTVNQVNGIDDIYDDTQKHQLTFCVSDSFGDRKQAVIDAMNGATVEGWMSVADLTFTYVPEEDANCTASNNNVWFDVNPTSGGQFIARAFFPSSPRDQRNVLIDDTAFDIGPEDPFNLTNVLAHETGHAIGFATSTCAPTSSTSRLTVAGLRPRGPHRSELPPGHRLRLGLGHALPAVRRHRRAADHRARRPGRRGHLRSAAG